MSKQIKVGIIGGTGIDQDPNLVKDKVIIDLEDTPYGRASDTQAIHGYIEGVPVYVIARHGKNHDVNPSNVNYRANIWTLVKQLGCTHILATSACGSLQANIKPGDIGILNDYFDRTKGKRQDTFYKVIHVEQENPIDDVMQKFIGEACVEHNLDHHKNLTCVCIEGPRFSTRAESKCNQKEGFHVVNMTTVPEVPLIAELGVIYGCIMLITDYDCWNDGEQKVDATLVVERMKGLGAKARKIIPTVIAKIKNFDWSGKTKENADKVERSIMAK